MYHLCTYEECLSCYDVIDCTNFVLYKDNLNENWKSCFYCSQCVKYMLETKWPTFIKMLEELDCKATFKRILIEGVPSYFKDKKLSECHIILFYFDNSEQPSLYKNSLTEDESAKLLENVRASLEEE